MDTDSFPEQDTSRRRKNGPHLNIDTASTVSSQPTGEEGLRLNTSNGAAAAPVVALSPLNCRTPTSLHGNRPQRRALNPPNIKPNRKDCADLRIIDMAPPIIQRHHALDDQESDLLEGEFDSRVANPLHASTRDSHDLSLPGGQVRDSLVANMLLSLDQFSFDQMHGGPVESNIYDPFGSQDPAGRSTTINSRTAPRTGGGHQYRYSSDYEGADDSSRRSKGRRSNSSLGFQSSLGRINSMREASQRSQPGTPRQMHCRDRRGSTSTSTSSINFGHAQVLGSQRWELGMGRRSCSFDYGHQMPSLVRQPTTVTPAVGASTTATTSKTTATTTPPGGLAAPDSPSPWRIELSNPVFLDEYDAAPTPTIPSGPRRLHAPNASNTSASSATSAVKCAAANPPTRAAPPPPHADPFERQSKSPAVECHKTARSPGSAAPSGRKSTMAGDRPPIPVGPLQDDIDAAPTPQVGHGKSKAHAHGTPPQTPPVKEKQGFFRRMFGIGSDSRNSSNNHSRSHGHQSIASSDTPARPQFNPTSRDLHHAPQVLQKKSSSFFRRRKKPAVADCVPPVPAAAPGSVPLPTTPVAAPASAPASTASSTSARSSPSTGPDNSSSALPPPLSLASQKDLLNASVPEPSPVSSLRRIMSPYLKNPTATNISTVKLPLGAPPQTHATNPVELDRGRVRGFSPDYEPPPSATIRSINTDPVEHMSARRDSVNRRAPDEPPRRVETPTRDPSEMRGEPDATFLHDNSENEPESPNTVKPKCSNPQEKGKRPVSPKYSPDNLPATPNRAWSRDVAAKLSSSSLSNLKTLPSPANTEEGPSDSLALPIEGNRSNRSSKRLSHTTSLPSLRIDGREMVSLKQRSPLSLPKPLDEPEVMVGDPTEDDRKKAQWIYDGNENFIQKDRAAAWMGEEGPVRRRTLRAYMELYDFANLSILAALRLVCGRLVLRGETQQVDRILVAFSTRWCECNPNNGFKAMDIVHTICYSIMLLNTDLHLADIDNKMTRPQFIKNTMGTVITAVEESVPDAFGKDTGDGCDGEKRNFRLSLMPPARPTSGIQQKQGGEKPAVDGCGPLVQAPVDGTQRGWETQVEQVLKDTYNSIREEKLPLFGAEPDRHTMAPSSQSSLSVINVLKRTPSVLSKAPSEGGNSNRGRMTETRTSRWTSKSRSRPRGFGAGGMSSSRTSFDDNNSVWSPTGSSATWSRYSLGRTQTSMSMDSFGSSWPRTDYQHSIGFATALSQAIIREEALGSGAASLMDEEPADSVLLDDESLELAGPPWVKEGIVTHKHHLDGIDKKAKDRNWAEVFAVIQKGCLSLFSFSANKSLGRKNRLRVSRSQNLANSGVVGGGNWQDNATNLGTFNLRQTLASILPPPGYSRTRPHVWALSLPTGAVHLFQVGTPEICKEFVTTSNYWSARLSTHPLVGGISNIEYGWSDAIVNNALFAAVNESENASGSMPGSSRPGSSAAGPLSPSLPSQGVHRRRSSAQSRSSIRSSIDHAVGRTTTAVLYGGGKLAGDKITISDWTPPQQSMRASNSPEPEQLAALQAYVKSIEEELQLHNQLRSPMLLAFTPRGHNAARAMQNWERKSSYLLKEIVKFRTYVDVLVQAEKRKDEIYHEREGVQREVTVALGMELSLPGGPSLEGRLGGEDNGRTSLAVDNKVA